MVTLPFLGVPYARIVNAIRLPARDTRRLAALARSPVYTHFGDALTGSETIRASPRPHWALRCGWVGRPRRQ